MTDTSNTHATSPAHLMELFAACAAAGDLDGLIELYEPDAIFQPGLGVVVEGHAQLRGALGQFLELQPQITYLGSAEVLTVGDIALVSNFWTMVGTAPDGTPVGESGTSADVCRRRPDGSWGVLIDQPRGEPTS